MTPRCQNDLRAQGWGRRNRLGAACALLAGLLGAAMLPAPAPAAAEALAAAMAPSVFEVRTPEGTGSGFVLAREGYGFTALHVVEGASAITLRFADGRETAAQLAAAEPRLDLALLAFPPEHAAVPLPLGDSAAVEVGTAVLSLGYPNGSGLASVPGTVAAIIPHPNAPLFKIDPLLAPGNSGGPVLNARGEGIGITFRGTVGDPRGYTYAVSMNAARALLARLPARP
jgi:S1-C subfamily serine protease